MNPNRLLSRIARVALVLTGFAMSVAQVHAQTGTGSIQGRVLNASNGSYLTSARVTVDGTKLEALTNQFGDYRLDGVPAGEAKVKVFYTGLTEKTLSVSVTAGATATQDFDLTSIGLAAAKEGDVIKLDQFVVASKKETDAAAIAINDQRFANNIKNVVSTDAFGDIAEGNIGDFVKFLPGVTIDYTSPDARTISVRGVAANYTSLTMNGNPVASANSSTAGRTIELEQISLSNASRIEVYKSRTPETAANALGGSVNLVPRSAFERSKPELNYRAFLSGNGDEKEFNKTRGPTNEASRKIKPGFDAVWVYPVSKTFGFTLSLLESNIYYPQHRTAPGWAPGQGAQVGATVEIPTLRNYQVQDGPKNNQRESVGATVDWKFRPTDVLSAGFQWSYYNASFSNRNVTYTIGNVKPADQQQTYVHGAIGAGSVSQGTSFRHKYGYTYQPDVTWRHNGPIWKLDAGASFSHATNHYHDYQDDHFENVALTLRGDPTGTAVNAATVNFDALDAGAYLTPTITVYNKAGTAKLNLADPANWNVTSAATNPADSTDVFRNLRFNAKRELNFSFPFALKAGAQLTSQSRDIRKDNPGTYTFVGKDGTANSASGDDNLSQYPSLIDPQYSSGPFLFGTPQVPSPNAYGFWTLFQQHPEYFTYSQATAITNLAKNSQFFSERITAGYIMADTRLVNNRLRVVTGVRFERTDDEGQGFIDNVAAAKGITDPVAAAIARYGIRKAIVRKHYGAGYPSADLSFTVTPELIARAAYSRSIGRPDLNNIIPGTTVPDISATSGTITVNNSGLAPTQTNSYDLSLEYYLPKAGVISVGAFRKDFTNFIGTNPAHIPTVQELLDLGIPDAANYANGVFSLATKSNVGDARITGVEFNYSQQLAFDFLPEWARNFSIYANGQKLHLEGSTIADFSNFIRESGSWGAKYGAKKYTIQANFNYRGRQRLTAQSFTPGAYDYFKPRVYLDANFEYRFRPEYRFFLNARNLTNVAQDIQRYGPTTPSYSRTYRREEFGVQYTAGVKGTF